MEKPSPPGAIIIVQQIQKHEWTLRLPRITEAADDQLEEGIDWIDEEPEHAASIFGELIAQFPEHIDAYHHLALALEKMGRAEEAFQIRKGGVAMALEFFPPHFSMGQDRLEWGWVTNRPFLRMYHSYGLQLLERGQTEDALEVFENILSLNPNDNQGARALVVDCHFAIKEPEGVLSVCRQYPKDAMEQLMYGRVLALYQLGRFNEALEALDLALKFYPLIATELLKSRHRKPKGTDETRVTLGSPEQAYLYWRDHGKYWKETPGAIEFLRRRVDGKAR